jgi:hypothetical protein
MSGEKMPGAGCLLGPGISGGHRHDNQGAHAMGETGTARAQWRKSSHSGGDNNCVEVAGTGTTITVRDSKNPRGGMLSFSPAGWQDFTRNIRRQSVPA